MSEYSFHRTIMAEAVRRLLVLFYTILFRILTTVVSKVLSVTLLFFFNSKLFSLEKIGQRRATKKQS